jgi:hypothetical protein
MELKLVGEDNNEFRFSYPSSQGLLFLTFGIVLLIFGIKQMTTNIFGFFISIITGAMLVLVGGFSNVLQTQIGAQLKVPGI